MGAKITSLRAAGCEWLLQPNPEPPANGVGKGFISVGLSGWDECIPTIDSCTLADGTVVPDHGSVWDRVWHHGARLARVVVPASGFEFRREARRDAAGALVLHYAVRNTSARRVNVLWAAHPQLQAPPGTVVETSTPHLVQTYPDVEPTAPSSTITIDDVPLYAARKFYTLPESPAEFARIRRPDGRWLEFAWDPKLVPHLGIWLDAGAFAHRPVIAIEPCIGWYDNLCRAIGNQTSIELAPDEVRRWWIRLTAGTGTTPAS